MISTSFHLLVNLIGNLRTSFNAQIGRRGGEVTRQMASEIRKSRGEDVHRCRICSRNTVPSVLIYIRYYVAASDQVRGPTVQSFLRYKRYYSDSLALEENMFIQLLKLHVLLRRCIHDVLGIHYYK
jgi:hypothetical protein